MPVFNNSRLVWKSVEKGADASPMTTLTSPHDLLSAIPFLVGFKPEDSIVLMSIKNDSIFMALRIDFPDSLDPDQINTLISHLQRDDAEAAIAVYYIPESSSDADLMIKTITDAIDEREIHLRESLIVHANRWRSLMCEDSECCPPEGSPLPELDRSRIAAEQVALGKPIPFESVDELINSISALEADQELLTYMGEIPEIDYEGNSVPLQREGAEAITDFIADFVAEGLCRDKKLLALLLVRLLDLQVRDFALGSVTADMSETYFSAWRWLLRIAPEGYVAPVATVFAAIAYERGDGAIAHRALDRAEIDNPDYAMTGLLRQVFSAGWSPQSFSAMRAELHPKICDALFSGTMSV